MALLNQRRVEPLPVALPTYERLLSWSVARVSGRPAPARTLEDGEIVPVTSGPVRRRLSVQLSVHAVENGAHQPTPFAHPAYSFDLDAGANMTEAAVYELLKAHPDFADATDA